MIQPDISLQVHPLQLEDPLTQYQRAISIGDMASQIQQRNQMAGAQQAEAQLRIANAQAQQRQLDNQNVLRQATDANAKWDPDKGDTDFDDEGVQASLHAAGRDDLYPAYQQQRDQFKAQHRQAQLADIQANDATLNATGLPADNFLALSKEERTPEAYQSMLQDMSAANKGSAAQLPAQYDGPGGVADQKLQEFADHRKLIQSAADQMNEAQARENAQITSDLNSVRSGKMTPQQYWEKLGNAPGSTPSPQWQAQLTAKLSGLPAPSAATFQTKFDHTIDGGSLASGADAKTISGDQVPDEWRKSGQQLAFFTGPRQDGSFGPYYEKGAGFRPTAFSQKQDLAEKAYAEKLGIDQADMTDEQKGAAQGWVASNLSPQKKTDLQRRIDLAQTNPDLFSFISGHPLAGVTKPMTDAQRAQTLHQITTEYNTVSKNSPDPNLTLEKYTAQKIAQLKTVGVDLTPPAAPGSPRANTPKTPAPVAPPLPPLTSPQAALPGTGKIFNVAKWQTANPKGDVAAATAQARAQGYTIK